MEIGLLESERKLVQWPVVNENAVAKHIAPDEGVESLRDEKVCPDYLESGDFKRGCVTAEPGT